MTSPWPTHAGDGRVMCCLCLEYVPRDRLHRLDGCALEDVCQTCAESERVESRRRDAARRRLYGELMRERFGK